MHAFQHSRLRVPTLLSPLLLTLTLLPACASMDGTTRVDDATIPEGAVASSHTAANGDVISEYRVDGQLRMVRVQPARGPVYYLIDHNGDGHADPKDGDLPLTYYKVYGW